MQASRFSLNTITVVSTGAGPAVVHDTDDDGITHTSTEDVLSTSEASMRTAGDHPHSLTRTGDAAHDMGASTAASASSHTRQRDESHSAHDDTHVDDDDDDSDDNDEYFGQHYYYDDCVIGGPAGGGGGGGRRSNRGGAGNSGTTRKRVDNKTNVYSSKHVRRQVAIRAR